MDSSHTTHSLQSHETFYAFPAYESIAMRRQWNGALSRTITDCGGRFGSGFLATHFSQYVEFTCP